MVEYLKRLLADMHYLAYKVHSIHTDITGALFSSVHSLTDDLYNYLWAQEDWIKERVRQMHDFTPSSLEELSKLKTIEEIDSVPNIQDSLIIIRNDLLKLVEILKEWKKMAGEKDDLDTQEMLISVSKSISVYEWKVRSILSIK